MPTPSNELIQQFSWDVGNTVLYWWLVQGQTICPQAGITNFQNSSIICNSNSVVKQSSTMILAATDVSSVCQKVKESGFIWPIQSISMYSTPAQKSDILAGIDYSNNILESVYFEDVSDCIDLALQQATHVVMKMKISVSGIKVFYIGHGGISLTGSAIETDSGISIGTSLVEMGMTINIFNMSNNIFPQVLQPLVLPSSLVVTNCGCEQLPYVLFLAHNFIGWDNKFDYFIQKNAIIFPNPISLTYNGSTWRQNLIYSGIGSSNLIEKWNCIFEWSCSTIIEGIDTQQPAWKFSAIFRQNVNNVNLNTKLSYIFSADEICVQNVFDFSFYVNTIDNSVLNTNPNKQFNNPIKIASLIDGLSLFKNIQLRFDISESAGIINWTGVLYNPSYPDTPNYN